MGFDNKKSITLSIGIPTYNGGKHIKETLDSIVSQLNDVNEEIEIVISDNASTDETPEIIKDYQNRYGIIKYFRNGQNVGFDRNVDLLFERAIGKYVWLLSDDDLILPGSIRKVLKVLSKHPELAAVFVNWSNYSCDLKKCNVERTINISEDILCKTADEFLSTVKLNPVLISANVISRDLWKSIYQNDPIGAGWAHYKTLLSLIVGHHTYCIAQPYVIYRSGNTRWNKEGEQSILNGITLMQIINSLISRGYSRKSVGATARVILLSQPQGILICKIQGLSLKKFRIGDMIKQFNRYPSFWLSSFPLLLIPESFYSIIFKAREIKFLRNIYKILKKGVKYVFIRT